ncbi:hypothetical protein U1Q18_005528 [Sarracenia purpurea var. burkii]
MSTKNKFIVLGSISSDEYENGFPLLSGSKKSEGSRLNRFRVLRSSSVPNDRSGLESQRFPKPRRDVIKKALCIHINMEEFLKDNPKDTKMTKILQSEKESLESEVTEYSKCLDSLLPVRMAAIEARIKLLKGLSPIKLDIEVSLARYGVKTEDTKPAAILGEEISEEGGCLSPLSLARSEMIEVLGLHT